MSVNEFQADLGWRSWLTAWAGRFNPVASFSAVSSCDGAVSRKNERSSSSRQYRGLGHTAGQSLLGTAIKRCCTARSAPRGDHRRARLACSRYCRQRPPQRWPTPRSIGNQINGMGRMDAIKLNSSLHGDGRVRGATSAGRDELGIQEGPPPKASCTSSRWHSLWHDAGQRS